jgi:hypothetical protein
MLTFIKAVWKKGIWRNRQNTKTNNNPTKNSDIGLRADIFL